MSPPNAILDPFVPLDRVMPFLDVMATNGGYGGIHFALSHGLPPVVAGQTEDKVETCARVAWAGVGINLRSQRPKPAKLRAAVLEVLSTPRFRDRAKVIQTTLARLDGPTRGAELLE